MSHPGLLDTAPAPEDGVCSSLSLSAVAAHGPMGRLLPPAPHSLPLRVLSVPALGVDPLASGSSVYAPAPSPSKSLFMANGSPSGSLRAVIAASLSCARLTPVFNIPLAHSVVPPSP